MSFFVKGNMGKWGGQWCRNSRNGHSTGLYMKFHPIGSLKKQSPTTIIRPFYPSPGFSVDPTDFWDGASFVRKKDSGRLSKRVIWTAIGQVCTGCGRDEVEDDLITKSPKGEISALYVYI